MILGTGLAGVRIAFIKTGEKRLSSLCIVSRSDPRGSHYLLALGQKIGDIIYIPRKQTL
jgi:hypothetical protein